VHAEEKGMLQTSDSHIRSFFRNQYDALIGNLTYEQGRHCSVTLR